MSAPFGRIAGTAALVVVAVLGASTLGGCDRTLDSSWGQGGYTALSSPTVGIDGAVMFTTHGEAHEVVCLAVWDGWFGWSVPLDGGSAATVPVVAEHGTAYVADGDRLRVIDRDGVLVESRRVDGVLGAGPAVGRGGTLYLAGASDEGGGFLEATTADGERLWRDRLDEVVPGQPMVRRDGAVLVETDTRLVAFDRHGERLWSRTLDPSDGVPGVIGPDDAAYVVRGGALVVVDRDGQLEWTVPGVVGAPAVANGEVVVPTVDGLVALDDDDGAERWWVDLACGPAAIGRDGHAYAGCVSDQGLGLVEIDPDGAIEYADALLPPGAPPIAAPVLTGNHAVLTAEADVFGWKGAAGLAGDGSPRAGSDNYSTGRAR